MHMHDSSARLVIHRDAHLLVVNKPAGVPVHGSRQFEDNPRTLISLLREETGDVVHPVHRLDRGVSGLMLFALDRNWLKILAKQFEQREVDKRYLAIVRGWLDRTGEVDHPLGATRDEGKQNEQKRQARTVWLRLAETEIDADIPPYDTARYSLLQLRPLTGRRHQLRRHMKHISHPIIGDTSYGRGEHNRLFRNRFDCRRILLHSWRLDFQHPETGTQMAFQSNPDGSFRNVLERLGWSDQAVTTERS